LTGGLGWRTTRISRLRLAASRRAGGSNYPYLLLVEAGVDMAKPGPYRAIVAKMNAIMDEMEALLDEIDG